MWCPIRRNGAWRQPEPSGQDAVHDDAAVRDRRGHELDEGSEAVAPQFRFAAPKLLEGFGVEGVEDAGGVSVAGAAVP